MFVGVVRGELESDENRHVYVAFWDSTIRDCHTWNTGNYSPECDSVKV